MPHRAAAKAIGPLRILLVEDSAEDAELMSEQLLEAGFEARFERVDERAAMADALARFQPDIVLSDLTMPGFSGYEALSMVQEATPTTPFIFVSGTIGEDQAVQALQQGAADYILKHNPVRLPTAVERAVRLARSEADRDRAERELLRSQRLDMLAMLAAGLSHDLRNVLQPLLIVPDLLNARSEDPKIRRLGEVISECGRRGHEMADSMLQFVRGARANREHVQLTELFRAVKLLLQGSLPRGVDFEIEAPGESLGIEVNYTELQQTLLNLALNAIQAMPNGGTVRLLARAEQHEGQEFICIDVADTGVGMDEQTQAKLFTPFFTTKTAGTGLGLISCKRIVESYGGNIAVRSTPGVGTTFEVRLPLSPDVLPEAPGEVIADGRGRRVLVVDGDFTRLTLLVNAFSGQGYAPVQAPDGAYALRMLDAGMPDLVVLDTDISLLPAGQLMRALAEVGYEGPVIALESPAQPLDRATLPVGTVLHVLAKPVEMRSLLLTAGRALESGGG
jgi:signal transduction histidine kinase